MRRCVTRIAAIRDNVILVRFLPGALSCSLIHVVCPCPLAAKGSHPPPRRSTLDRPIGAFKSHSATPS